MASQSPTAADRNRSRGYLEAWSELTRLLSAGHSWSGHERDVAFLNLGDGRFADVSWVSGLDAPQDGRAVASVDWDGDGDLDLWSRARSGPQLRFLRNEGQGEGATYAFRLRGTATNRDGIGARVELLVEGPARRVRWLQAGEGYLAQSSATVSFRIPETERPREVQVDWPGGETERFGLAGPGIYSLVEASGSAERLPRSIVALDEEVMVPDPGSARPGDRVVLREPLPLPPSLLAPGAEVGGEMTPRLINLWAHWCEPCVDDLYELAGGSSALREAGLDVVAWSVDAAEDRRRAVELFATVRRETGAGGFANRFITSPERETLDAILSHVLGVEGS